jgi:colicin import membrane protein
VPRTLKTFITNLGFFELAIAAPSMKAALEAWGLNHNAFQHGFAKQTDDPRIIAATNARPGVVLKRAVGSKGAFGEDAELPKTLPNRKPPKVEAPRQPKPQKAKPSKKADRADIISFEKARAKREKERAAEEARVEKTRAARQRATDSAEAALEAARERHTAELAAIESDQSKLDRRGRKERGRWEAERKKLEDAVERAKGNR